MTSRRHPASQTPDVTRGPGTAPAVTTRYRILTPQRVRSIDIRAAVVKGWRHTREVDVRAKLQLRTGQHVAVIAMPDGSGIDLPDGVRGAPDADNADAVVLFAVNQAELDRRLGPLLEAARADKLAWVVYPKGGQRGTDLNRDTLARHLAPHGIRPVRQVAVDDVWSALRFRPGSIDNASPP